MRCFVPEFSRKLFLGLPTSQITIFSYKPSHKIFFFVLYSSENVVLLFTTSFQKRDFWILGLQKFSSLQHSSSATKYIHHPYIDDAITSPLSLQKFILGIFLGKQPPSENLVYIKGWGGFKME